jgi:hypothetical protein
MACMPLLAPDWKRWGRVSKYSRTLLTCMGDLRFEM